MSHGLLADSVDMSLASLLYSCKTDAVLSEVHGQWVSRERHVKLMHCLSAVAELLVQRHTVVTSKMLVVGYVRIYQKPDEAEVP